MAAVGTSTLLLQPCERSAAYSLPLRACPVHCHSYTVSTNRPSCCAAPVLPGVDGVLSAESLLEDPSLFWPPRAMPGVSCFPCIAQPWLLSLACRF